MKKYIKPLMEFYQIEVECSIITSNNDNKGQWNDNWNQNP